VNCVQPIIPARAFARNSRNADDQKVDDRSAGRTGFNAQVLECRAKQPQPRHELTMRPRLEIEYCTQCRWLLRAAWMAQEVLTTFEVELGEVALIPGSGGTLEIRLDGVTIFSRKEQARFPELKELKQLIRDQIAPDKELGHSDRK